MKPSYSFLMPLLLLAGMVVSCEKDDICLEGTEGTPRLQIGFFDSDNPEVAKSVSSLQIKAVSIDSVVPNADGFLLPLRVDQAFTEFEFTLNSGSDTERKTTVQFNYDRWDEYINRACGFRGHFILNQQSVAQKNLDSSWIRGFKVLQDTISNEETVHLALYH